jgi:hypothetical protein
MGSSGGASCLDVKETYYQGHYDAHRHCGKDIQRENLPGKKKRRHEAAFTAVKIRENSILSYPRRYFSQPFLLAYIETPPIIKHTTPTNKRAVSLTMLFFLTGVIHGDIKASKGKSYGKEKTFIREECANHKGGAHFLEPIRQAFSFHTASTSKIPIPDAHGKAASPQPGKVFHIASRFHIL